MKQVSKKQAYKNRELSKIKSKLDKKCFICGNFGDDLAHLLPKSIFPEHYTNENNLVIMCRTCHNLHDNDVTFRSKQLKCYFKAITFDLMGANRYYRQ